MGGFPARLPGWVPSAGDAQEGGLGVSSSSFLIDRSKAAIIAGEHVGYRSGSSAFLAVVVFLFRHYYHFLNIKGQVSLPRVAVLLFSISAIRAPGGGGCRSQLPAAIRAEDRVGCRLPRCGLQEAGGYFDAWRGGGGWHYAASSLISCLICSASDLKFSIPAGP